MQITITSDPPMVDGPHVGEYRFGVNEDGTLIWEPVLGPVN